MKYFLHDTNAFHDEKISELYINYGYEGLGLFYTVLEKIASQEKPIKTTVLKSQLNIGKRLEKCWCFMESLGIITSINGETFNKQLLNYSEKYKIKKEKNAKRISQWRDNQLNSENVTHSESIRNTPKVKESKIKESKVNDDDVVTTPPIDGFRNIESLKQILLDDRDYIGLVSQNGVEVNKVPGWLDAFNRFLKMRNTTLKQQTDYRTHFPRWLTKIPGYRTMNPDDYSPMRMAEVNKPGATKGDEAFKKLMK